MKKIRITKNFTCDELNEKLGLPTKVFAIIKRGEDIEFVFEEEDDVKINQSMVKILAQFQSYFEKERKKITNIQKGL